MDCLRFNSAVFLESCSSRICLLLCSNAWRTSASSARSPATCSLDFVISALTADTAAFNSSISLLRPRRLLEFLNAPPVMEPPGLSCSPSSVTILNECLYFLAIASALSILSTTRILPSRYFASFSYSNETRTRSLAAPITPFSFMHGSPSKVLRTWIAESGRNVARPKRFCFK